MLASGFIFSLFEKVHFINELYLIYIIFGYIVLFAAVISKFLSGNFVLVFIERYRHARKASVIFASLVIYSLLYYSSTGVIPPIIAPLFGQHMLANRLALTYNKSSEFFIFYGSTIFKDYLLGIFGVVSVFRWVKSRKSFFPVLIYFFLVAYMGRKSSIALALIAMAIGFYNMGYISKTKRNTLFIVGGSTVVLFFVLYGSSNLFFDIGVRVFLQETAYSYKHYLYYWNDPEIGMNIFNFPLSESVFGIDFRNIRQEAYTMTFGSRVAEGGIRNGQGYAPLLLMLGMGPLLGGLVYTFVVSSTFLMLHVFQNGIEQNRENVSFFILYYFLLGQANNYLSVNIFSILDITLIHYKFALLLSLLILLSKINLYKNVFTK